MIRRLGNSTADAGLWRVGGQAPRGVMALILLAMLGCGPRGAAGERERAPAPGDGVPAAAAEVAAQPDDPGAHRRLGSAYYEIGELDRALAAFRRAVALDARDIAALVNVGVILTEQGDPAEALEAFRRARAIDPQDALAAANEGIAHYALGDTAAAVDCWGQALGADPENVLAHFYLGVAFADAGIAGEAIREWEAVIAAEPEGAAAAQARRNIARLRRRAASDD